MDIVNPNKAYHESEHLVYSCQYHIVFCPKFRRAVIKDEIETTLKQVFYEVADKYEFQIVDMETMPDHVHLIISCNPRFGIMECIKKLKGTSANVLRDMYPQLKTQLPNMWTRNTFVSTVGSVSLDVVKKYIENQKNK